MLTRYLLAAEADKIQDLIFRSSRLREVVGGSQLLTRFCEEVPAALIRHYRGNFEKDAIIYDGGSFRVLFNQEKTAREFGEHLSEIYRIATGGSLTVAEPVAIPEPLDENFTEASEQAEFNLRQAKRKNKGWWAQEHLPYMAICTSCGIGLAKTLYRDVKNEYLCQSCLHKNAESGQGNLNFLEKFYKIVLEEENMPLDKYSWPGLTEFNNRSEKDPTEDVADYDLNRYVAYLVADGNDMGEVFGKCQKRETMKKLSKKLDLAICRALAKPTKAIMKNNQLNNRPNFIPVLPLILGGDELFALIPAPWALDFAISFCNAYEQEMIKVYEETELFAHVPKATISATVVICKNKHPYTLAYEVAEATLKKAKQLYRKIALDRKEYHSIVNFEVVAGGQLTSIPSNHQFQPTLKPYLVKGNDIDGSVLPLQRLIDQRWSLRHIPSKRLHELQSLYDLAKNNLPSSRQLDQMAPWRKRLDRLLERIDLRSEKQKIAVEKALSELGGISGWCEVRRPHESIWSGHGFPDLLDAWDFALSLDKPAHDYEEE